MLNFLLPACPPAYLPNAFSMVDVTSARLVPFGILQYLQCAHHGLTFVLLCVPFIFTDSARCHFALACMASSDESCYVYETVGVVVREYVGFVNNGIS